MGGLRVELAGKVALVTGGSRGLGREIAAGLAACGADVVLASRDLPNCERAAAEIAAESDRRVLPVACNVSRWDEVESLAATAYEKFGQVDVLVNNAGMSPLYESVGAISESLWDKVLAVNLKGPFRLAALVGERMAAGEGGSIINVSSAAASHPRPEVVPYAAAKAGLEAVTVALAHALGPSVRVNAISPGTFFTDVSKHWDMDAFAQRAESFALGRGGEPAEIVGAALFLASDASSYVTGATIAVDGGFTG
ncbi:MAG: SDR family NAD(P)-dependent oxidoreductase [Solirubrobacterales bacterium]